MVCVVGPGSVVARLVEGGGVLLHAPDSPAGELLIMRNLIATPLCPDSGIMPCAGARPQRLFTKELTGPFCTSSAGVLCSTTAS